MIKKCFNVYDLTDFQPLKGWFHLGSNQVQPGRRVGL